LAKKFADSDVVTIADVDCTTGGEPVCQRMGVKGYPTIKYFTDKTGKGGRDYQGGRDLGSLTSFVQSTFKAQCNALTGAGCNEQEKRYIEKTKDKSPEELVEEQKAKEADLKALKKERDDAAKEMKEKEKKWKSKETALQKAILLLKQFQKSGNKKKKEDL